MIRYILILLLAALFCTTVQAQELMSRRTQADRLFERAEYFRSLEIYLRLTEADNVPVEVIERIADCYRLMNNYEQAEDWYARLVKMPDTRIVDVLFYAEALQRNQKFALAKDNYKRYYANETDKSLMNFKLAACDSAAIWIKREGNYKVSVEKKINSTFSDWGPTYLGKTAILFTSDRSTSEHLGDKGIYNRTGNEWLKMFNYDLKSGQTSEIAFDRQGDINLAKDYHTGSMAVNATGDTAYITVTTRAGKGSLADVKTKYDDHLYIRRLELLIVSKYKDKWARYTRFPYNNVSTYSVGHAALSPNGQLLYFTSDMPGGMGKTDIWYCQKQKDGTWGKPVNCGNKINTPGDEAFPSIGGDGRLYFSSKGLPGMGGYDIFAATGSGGTWTNPVNLKYPLNSTSDDFGLITVDGKSGYLASDRQGGQGSDDIYSFTYTGADDKLQGRDPFTTPDPTALAANPTAAGPALPLKPVLLEGSIINNASPEGIDSVVVMLRNARGEAVDGFLVRTGNKFTFNIVPDENYTIEARKKGFYPVGQHISGKSISSSGPLAYLELAMEPLTVGKTFIIRNIYYDLNRANIRADAIPEMDDLVNIMKENPALKIELSSHTDARGSDYYNMLLSEARAVSAVAYLRRHGIAADRMIAKGYGETRLLNECANGVRCSEEDHQFNRRTEIKVISGAGGK